jgi:hypothetical protein
MEQPAVLTGLGRSAYFRPLATAGRHLYGQSMGIRAQLIDRTDADLARIRRERARSDSDDLTRAALVEREDELIHLLDDLEHGVLSPGVLAGAAQLRTRALT